jgi:hypothetical protein
LDLAANLGFAALRAKPLPGVIVKDSLFIGQREALSAGILH